MLRIGHYYIHEKTIHLVYWRSHSLVYSKTVGNERREGWVATNENKFWQESRHLGKSLTPLAKVLFDKTEKD